MIYRILGHDYTLQYDPTLDLRKGTTGDHCANILTINIEPRVPGSVQKTTLIHETIEAINYHLQLDLPHDVRTKLEAGLYAVMADNPAIFQITLPRED